LVDGEDFTEFSSKVSREQKNKMQKSNQAAQPENGPRRDNLHFSRGTNPEAKDTPEEPC
jgi:hypothetical protein